ncbi:hypothetical protein FQA39_LY14033 [Lamprigera yunnana]|nr:hypothetical protein FQA39_LY14033 [Lamprigera yunnana]
MNSLREGTPDTFLARELVPGDIVLLNIGDRILADLWLFESIDLTIDECSFTGETEPAHKQTAPVLRSNGTHSSKSNIAFMGTLLCCGSGKPFEHLVGLELPKANSTVRLCVIVISCFRQRGKTVMINFVLVQSTKAQDLESVWYHQINSRERSFRSTVFARNAGIEVINYYNLV